MRKIEEVKKKLVSIVEDIENLEALKEAAINQKQYAIAKSCNAQLAVKKRDRFIVGWFLEE